MMARRQTVMETTTLVIAVIDFAISVLHVALAIAYAAAASVHMQG
jgi:hypothetical protein